MVECKNSLAVTKAGELDEEAEEDSWSGVGPRLTSVGWLTDA